MRFFIALGLLFAVMSGQAQSQGKDFFDPEEMSKVREMSRQNHGGQPDYLVFAERLEYRSDDGDESLAWGAQGWYGSDLNKLWLKTEGHYDLEESSMEEAEVQALFSRAFSPFWDVQFGVRHDFEPEPSRSYAVVGLQGLASYWFEMGTALFLSDEGDASLRLEAEYELRLSQRFILQPRMELNYAFSEDLAIDSVKGMNHTEFGLRLRYEIKSEFSPYLGVSWEKEYGHHQDTRQFMVVAGIRAWF